MAIVCARDGTSDSSRTCRRGSSGTSPGRRIRLVIGVSGVRATKTGNARALQPRLGFRARAPARLERGDRSHWTSPSPTPSRAIPTPAIGSRDSRQWARRSSTARYLAPRFAQFREEVEVIVPRAGDALRDRDFASLGTLVDRSMALATTALGNQVPETIFLARRPARKIVSGTWLRSAVVASDIERSTSDPTPRVAIAQRIADIRYDDLDLFAELSEARPEVATVEPLRSDFRQPRESLAGIGIAREGIGEGRVGARRRRVPTAQERARGVGDAVVARARVAGLRRVNATRADDEAASSARARIARVAPARTRMSDVIVPCADDRHVICAPPRAPTPSSPAKGPKGAPVSIAPKYSARASGSPKMALHASSSSIGIRCDERARDRDDERARAAEPAEAAACCAA